MRWVLTVVLLLTSCTGVSEQASTTTTTIAPATTAGHTVVVRPADGLAPRGVDPTSSCMQRAVFGDPAASMYLLPYPVGDSYQLNQSYCFAQGTHNDELSYDFAMAIGSDVLASRAGTVFDLYDGSPDDGIGQANYLIIQHDDGTAALYGHLQHEGILVALGEEVAAGERIATSGFSGVAGYPHLHFTVYGSWPSTVGGGDIAVNFRNADGPVDFLGGLITGARYLALPVDQSAPGMVPRLPGSYRSAQLADVDLAGAVLWGFDFTGANLAGATLTGANLEWARLDGATLRHADLSRASLADADVTADLTGADLTGADLTRADMSRAVLVGADLTGAVLWATTLTGADLTDAILDDTTLIGVTWDDATTWPAGYVPPPRP